MTKTWLLDSPLDAIIFDCDGTLSQIEGINYLAELSGVAEQVKALTEQAMAHTGVTQALYFQRISRVRPSRAQALTLAEAYFSRVSPDLIYVIAALQKLGKVLFVVSAGINPSVKGFAQALGIPENRVYAVDVQFDEDGQYASYDQQSPLTTTSGKSLIIERLKAQFPNVMLVGDGMNDVEASQSVSRFVGYGGAYYREKIAKLSPFYIKCASMLPVLALALTKEEASQLPADLQSHYECAVDLVQHGEVLFHPNGRGV